MSQHDTYTIVDQEAPACPHTGSTGGWLPRTPGRMCPSTSARSITVIEMANIAPTSASQKHPLCRHALREDRRGRSADIICFSDNFGQLQRETLHPSHAPYCPIIRCEVLQPTVNPTSFPATKDHLEWNKAPERYTDESIPQDMLYVNDGEQTSKSYRNSYICIDTGR